MREKVLKRAGEMVGKMSTSTGGWARRRTTKMKMIAVAAIAVGMATMMPTASVFAAPPVYRSNEYDDLMITRIIPAESYLELTYMPTGKRSRMQTPLFINVQFGGLSDAILHGIGTGVMGGHTQILGRGGSGISQGVLADGEVLRYGRSDFNPGVELSDNSMNIIDYVVKYNAGGEEQRSRADYSRCVNSSVFISGAATECRLERIGSGRIQYQPYTATGVRVAIPADEDAILTGITENWRAEPGEWGPEWYEDEGDSDDEGGSGSEDTSGSGSDEGGSKDESNNPGDEGNNPGDEGNNPGDEGTGGSESEGGFSTEDKGSSEDNKDRIANEESLIGNSKEENDKIDEGENQNAGSIGTSGKAEGNTSRAESASNARGQQVAANNSSEVVVSQDESSDSLGSDELINSSEVKSDKGDEVGVPNLGRETEEQPNWTALFAICIASVAGLVGWFFLFFGKHHLIKRKEKKE